jgi:hypothetical protein
MRFTIAPATPAVRPGIYNAVLTQIEERSGENGPYLLWHFELANGGGVLRRPTSTRFGPQSNARKIIEALTGEELLAGQTVEAEDLIGRPCRLVVGTATLPDGRRVARIEQVVPADHDFPLPPF